MADRPYGYTPNPIIDGLELSVRASNVLRNWGRVNTLEDFMALDKATVMRLPKAGVRTWNEIKHMQDNLRVGVETVLRPVKVQDTTLRDQVALAALPALIARADTTRWGAVAYLAFQIADAFVAEKEKRK